MGNARRQTMVEIIDVGVIYCFGIKHAIDQDLHPYRDSKARNPGARSPLHLL